MKKLLKSIAVVIGATILMILLRLPLNTISETKETLVEIINLSFAFGSGLGIGYYFFKDEKH